LELVIAAGAVRFGNRDTVGEGVFAEVTVTAAR
jgi:hypothetical protein